MNIRRWLITIIACAIILAGLAYYKTSQIQSAIALAEAFPEPSETVEATLSQSHPIQSAVTTIGEVIAPQAITLRNELEGRISEVKFVSGDQVTRGQILLQQDIREETARLNSAKASAKLAQSNLNRIQQLRKTQVVSEERLDNARTQYDIALAEIDALEAIIAKKTLRAPFDARTGLHTVNAGEFLEANTTITTLVGLTDVVWVDFSLPLQQATVELGSTIDIHSVDGRSKTISGKIIARDSVMSATSRNLQYRAQIPNHLQFPPNAVVNVSVPLGENKMLTTVPVTAVNRDSIGEFVYVLTADPATGGYRAKRQAITSGKKEEQTIAITSGLDPDTLVATNGSFKLREGLLVYVKERQLTNSTAN